jgi:FAD synthase
MKFADFHELGEQIKRDAQTARDYFANIQDN